MGKRKLQSIKRDDLIRFFNVFKSEASLRMAYAVVGSSFHNAKGSNLIHTNIAVTAIKAKRADIKKNKRNGKIKTTTKKASS